MNTFCSNQTNVCKNSAGYALEGYFVLLNYLGKIILSKNLLSEVELGTWLLYKDLEPIQLSEILLIDNAISVEFNLHFLILLSDGSFVSLIEHKQDPMCLENYFKFIQNIKECIERTERTERTERIPETTTQIKTLCFSDNLAVYINNTLFFWRIYKPVCEINIIDTIYNVVWYAHTSQALLVCTFTDSKVSMQAFSSSINKKSFLDYFNDSEVSKMNDLLVSKITISKNIIFLNLNGKVLSFYDGEDSDIYKLIEFVDTLTNVVEIEQAYYYAFLLSDKKVIFLSANNKIVDDLYYDTTLSLELFRGGGQSTRIPQLNDITHIDSSNRCLVCYDVYGCVYSNHTYPLRDFIPTNLKKYRICTMGAYSATRYFTTSKENELVVYDANGCNITDEVFACGPKINLLDCTEFNGSYI